MPPQTRSRQKLSSKNDGSDRESSKATETDTKDVKEEPASRSTASDSDDGEDAMKTPPSSSSSSSSSLPTPSVASKALRMSYIIGPGETGVLTFEPYKSLLLPLWRFRTIPIAQQSSSDLFNAFNYYLEAGDFVGADMARKFLQMGMTRAGRYANYAGGRKYERGGAQKEKSAGHAGRDEKLGAKEVFRAVWDKARSDGRYAELKDGWRSEKNLWEKERKNKSKKQEM